MNISERVAEEAKRSSESLARQTENVILSVLAKRMRCEVNTNGTTTYFFDEKPLVIFYPVKIECEAGKTTFSQEYQVHK